MKYGGGTAAPGFDPSAHAQGVIAPTSSGGMMFAAALDAQSSVIKTAPPGRGSAAMLIDFSPKQEPIDLAPLTSTHPCLQDLSKMPNGAQLQLEHYYMGAADSGGPSKGYPSAGPANAYYEYLNVGSAAYPSAQSGPSASSLLQPAAAAVVALGSQQHAQHQSAMYPYMAYSSHPHSHHQQQQLNGYMGQLDSCGQLASLEQQQRQLYKNGADGAGMLSPVDSGIGPELSLLEQAKQQLQLHEFFAPVSSLSSASVLIPAPQQQSVIQQQCQQEVGSQQQQAQQRQQREHHSRSGGGASGGEHHRESQHREQSLPVVIPKLDNPLGFQYTLEAPISTSIRKEDDRMTYVNKGQFYTISLDYLPDMHCPLKGSTVRSQVMVVFREDKSFEEELRTWTLWHKRQHSHKQRIIEVDAKNSAGAIGAHFDEIAHNAIQFCWNPAEQPGPKVSIAVQCLSTDFSTQKGVKGLPLHVQIDTYDDQADSKTPFHRGYCQIKVFCDKGANRKMLHENRRDERRRGGDLNTTQSTPDNSGGSGGRKKVEGEFHEACDRSHFYHSADLERPAALFVPGSEDFFFDTASIGSYDALSELEPTPKRPRTSERIMIYVRRQDEEIFTPLHLVPPTLSGLARAVSEKYNLDESKIEAFYKQCQKGVTVKIDDDMLRHYSNQDTFIMELKQSELDRHTFYSVTLIELLSANNSIGQLQSATPSATSSSSSAASEQQHLAMNCTTASATGAGTQNGTQQNGARGTAW